MSLLSAASTCASTPARSSVSSVRTADRNAAVAALASIADGLPSQENGSLRVPLRRRRGAIAEAVRRLDEAGVGIDDIALRRPTLDDVFLELTGHAAEAEGE